jgi:hypothetical protein
MGDWAPPAELLDVMLAAEDVRVKGEDRTVDRLKGLLEEVTRATGAATLVSMGETIGPTTEVGRPPGVRDRLSEIPIPPFPLGGGAEPFRASRDAPCTPVGVVLLLRL